MAQGLLLPLHPCFPLHLLCEHQTPHLELAKRHNTLLVCNIHLQNKEKNYNYGKIRIKYDEKCCAQRGRKIQVQA